MDRLGTKRLALAATAMVLALSQSVSAKAEKVTVKYSVKKGDTLLGISQRFGVEIEDIVHWNEDLKNDIHKHASKLNQKSVDKAAFKLMPGMKLKIPGKPTGKKKVVTYKVKKGDTLWGIGQKYHVKPAVIVKWNSDDLGSTEVKTSSTTFTLDYAAQNLKPGMVLSVPGKPTGKSKTIQYKVDSGDTLWAIGKKFNVKPQVIAKWNKDKLGGSAKGGSSSKGGSLDVDVDSLPVLQPGMKLVIHAVRPDLGERIAVLRVQKGHTPHKVAKAYSVSLKDLLAQNFLLPKDTLDVGDVLEVPLPVPQKNTRSVGAPNSGKLYGGELMPEGPGYRIRNPQLAYGTSELITEIIQCAAQVQREFDDTHDLVIGHLSKKGGGKLFPHKSHQSGRDVDLGYYHRKMSPNKFHDVTYANFDVARTSSLIDCFVDSGNVKYIFINTYIQKMLYNYHKKKKFTAEFLTTVFQYPHKGGKQLGIIRHEKGHDDHMHVRIFCPEGDSSCHD